MNAGADIAQLNVSGGIISEPLSLVVQAETPSNCLQWQAGKMAKSLLAMAMTLFKSSSCASGTNIKLGGGADTPIFTGMDGSVGNPTGASILGGAGADEIGIEGDVSMSATTIFGGGGSDLITVSELYLTVDSSMVTAPQMVAVLTPSSLLPMQVMFPSATAPPSKAKVVQMKLPFLEIAFCCVEVTLVQTTLTSHTVLSVLPPSLEVVLK